MKNHERIWLYKWMIILKIFEILRFDYKKYIDNSEIQYMKEYWI